MKAVKVGNIGTDHDGFHPTKVTAGSPDVFIDGVPAARVGDPLNHMTNQTIQSMEEPLLQAHPQYLLTGNLLL